MCISLPRCVVEAKTVKSFERLDKFLMALGVEYNFENWYHSGTDDIH